MFKILLSVCVFSSILIIASGNGDIGPGLWYVLNIQPCENNDQYEYKFNVSRHKISRHKEAYSAFVQLNMELGDDVAVKIDMCKHVDGGCKPYQVLGDDSLHKFLDNYAKENTIAALKNAGLDPPEFPLKAGSFQVLDFEMNMCELPKDGMEGVFGVDARLIRNKVDYGCMKCTVEFRKRDNIENYECED